MGFYYAYLLGEKVLFMWNSHIFSFRASASDDNVWVKEQNPSFMFCSHHFPQPLLLFQWYIVPRKENGDDNELPKKTFQLQFGDLERRRKFSRVSRGKRIFFAEGNGLMLHSSCFSLFFPICNYAVTIFSLLHDITILFASVFYQNFQTYFSSHKNAKPSWWPPKRKKWKYFSKRKTMPSFIRLFLRASRYFFVFFIYLSFLFFASSHYLVLQKKRSFQRKKKTNFRKPATNTLGETSFFPLKMDPKLVTVVAKPKRLFLNFFQASFLGKKKRQASNFPFFCWAFINLKKEETEKRTLYFLEIFFSVAQHPIFRDKIAVFNGCPRFWKFFGQEMVKSAIPPPCPVS